jgi:hypothetical protein
MMGRPRFATARQVFEAFASAAEDIEAAPSDIDPITFVEDLLRGDTPEDAISFCAYLLPRREAVWWACQCIRSIDGALGANDNDLLELAEGWVRQPEEENRKSALRAATAADLRTPAAWAAMGAGWSGGSLVDDPERPVPPAPYLTAKAIRAAVLTRLASAPVRERNRYLADCVQRAIKLCGQNREE